VDPARACFPAGGVAGGIGSLSVLRIIVGVIFFTACAVIGSVRAQVTAPVVTVEGRAPREPDTDRAKTATIVDRDKLDRYQAATVFDAVAGTPGVSVNGGPRASGMSFNIRGYGDTDDVLIKLDGAQKNFEKYRFGGTFIEPELLQSIKVTRGPDLLSGAGALGGTVEATTRDAVDLLRPGERYGARLKYGTASVNDEITRTGMAFARPRDDVDLLVAATRRTGAEYRTADGTTLPDSNVNQRSLLAKGTWFLTDAVSLGWTTTTVDNRSREAYDATGGVPGVFGSVLRGVDDTTHSANLRATGAGGLVDFTATVGQSTTKLTDLHRPGQTIFANAITGNLVDSFAYDVATAEVKNASRWRTGAFGHEFIGLVQHVRNTRDVQRVTENATINSSLYPGGFNPAQPPGSRDSVGVAAVHSLSLGPFTVSPGVRWDRNAVSAEGRARENMIRFGQPAEVAYVQTTASLGLTWRLPTAMPVILGYRYVQAFKPPLIDEVFTQGAFSRCTVPNLGSLTPPSGICGNLYRPERADTQEWSLTLPGIDVRPGLRLDGRLAYFRNERRHLLLSLRKMGDEVTQAGWEHREGVEFESNLNGRRYFGGLSYTRIQGQVYDALRYLDLFDAPGDTIAVSLGARFFSGKIDLGLRYRDVSARSAVIGLTTGNRPIVGRQAGYELLDVFLGFRPSPDVEYRVAVDNVMNEAYFLNNGFGGGIGAPAPGRSVRFFVAVQF